MTDATDIAARLRDPNRGWHPDQLEAAAEILRLRAELEAAKKDAARYGWLLRHYGSFRLCDEARKHGSLDAAIDAEMAKE